MFNDSNRRSFLLTICPNMPRPSITVLRFAFAMCTSPDIVFGRTPALMLAWPIEYGRTTTIHVYAAIQKEQWNHLVQTQFNKPNNIISVVVYNNVKTCDREIFPDGTIKQPAVEHIRTHRLHYDTWAEMGKLEEKVRCGKKAPLIAHTNEMALWSTILHKYHWICSHWHTHTHTQCMVLVTNIVVHQRHTFARTGKKIKHHKKVSFSVLACCQFFMGSFSLAFYCKSIRVFGFLFFIFLVRPSIHEQGIFHRIAAARVWNAPIVLLRWSSEKRGIQLRYCHERTAGFKQQTRSVRKMESWRKLIWIRSDRK